MDQTIGVVILNYMTWELTVKCVESIRLCDNIKNINNSFRKMEGFQRETILVFKPILKLIFSML